MKILHLISSLDARSGGTSEACAGMAAAQAAAGMDIQILSTQRTGESDDVVARLAANIGHERIRQIGPATGPLARHPDLASPVSVAVRNAHVIHLHGVWEEIQWLGAQAAVANKIPFVWAPHGMLDPWSLAQSRLKKKTYWWWRWRSLSSQAAAVHAITRSEETLAAPMFPSSQNFIVESLGHDIPRTPASPSSESREVLFLSRLHSKKNVECLLEACTSPRADWNLCIAGSGEDDYRRKLEAQVDLFGLGQRVRFTGDLRGAHKTAAWRGAAVFCLPSHQENFGIVVIEALAAGLPVLLSPAVGVAEDLSELPYVRVIDGGADEWDRAIRSVLDDAELRQLARVAGPSFVQERFSWDRIGKRWAAHYANLTFPAP